MKNLIRLSAFLFIIFSYSNVNAKSYFYKNTIAPNIIDSPIKVGSKEWNDEIRTIIELQKKPDSKTLEKARSERNFKPEMVAKDVDSRLTKESYPALYELLDNVHDTSHAIYDNTKKYWKTNRPYLADKRVKSLIKSHSNHAYPSGHTAGSYTVAYVLGQLIPEHRQKFYDRASEISDHRILVGMHFPHDIRGGKQLALLTTGALFENEDFRKDFAKAKTELENSK